MQADFESEGFYRATSFLSVNADTVSTSDPISLYERLMAVKPTALSKTTWAARAGLSRMIFSDIKRRGNARHDTIQKLLDAIELTFAQFEAGARAADLPNQPSEETATVRSPVLAFRGDDRPLDVEVVGTAQCADVEVDADDDSRVNIETMQLDFDDIIDHVRRPVVLDRRRDVYAIYFRGQSMAPRYEPGELAYIDPKRPPRPFDYVIAQLRGPDGSEGERIQMVIAKRLIRQSASFYEFEQFNPPLRFRIPRERVAHCHRIIPWDELVAF